MGVDREKGKKKKQNTTTQRKKNCKQERELWDENKLGYCKLFSFSAYR